MIIIKIVFSLTSFTVIMITINKEIYKNAIVYIKHIETLYLKNK